MAQPTDMVSFQRALNGVFLPEDIKQKALEDGGFSIKYRESVRTLLGVFAAQIRYQLAPEYKGVTSSVFFSILRTAIEAGLTTYWSSDDKKGDVQIVTNGTSSIIQLMFVKEQAVHIFKECVLAKLKDEDSALPFVKIPMETCFLGFPALRGLMTESKIMKGAYGKRVLALTFQDRPSLIQSKTFIQEKMIGGTELNHRKAPSLEIYEAPSENNTLYIEGRALVEFDCLCNQGVDSVLETQHLPKRARLKLKQVKAISPDIPWDAYLTAFPLFDQLVVKAKMVEKLGLKSLRLGFKSEEDLVRAQTIIEARLESCQYAYASEDVFTSHSMATSYRLYIQGVALLGLECICHLP